MGEIDTKPIKPVQMALSLLGEKGGSHQKSRSNGSDDEKERELESVLKDLACHKVQLEAKEAAHMQALLSLEQSQQVAEELAVLLKDARDSDIKALQRAGKAESDLAKEREAREEITKRMEMVERDVSREKEKCEELKQRAEIAENELAKEREAREELEKRVEMVEIDFKSEKEEHGKIQKLMETVEIDLKKEREERQDLKKLVEMAERDLSNEREQREQLGKQAEIAEADLSRGREEREELEQRVSELGDALLASEKEKNEIRSEKDADTELAKVVAWDLSKEWEELTQRVLELSDALLASEKEKNTVLSSKDTEIELAKEIIGRENEEIVELESRLLSVTILSDTLRLQLGEASEQLSISAKSASKAIDDQNFLEDELEIKDRKIFSQAALIEAYKMEMNELKSEKIEKETAEEPGNSGRDQRELIFRDVSREVEDMRKELEAALAKVAEFRNRSEQANSRAETAERAKSAIEDQLRKWREERQKKKKNLALALAPAREVVSEPRGTEVSSRHYQPLYKILNMKF